LNYPSDWSGAPGLDTTEMPLKICIRQMHTHRREAGRLLYAELEGDPAVAGDSALALADWPEGSVGGDFDTTDETWNQPRAVLSPIVMGDRNYHIYTGGWSLGRFPDHMFFLYGSLFWYPNGPNYVCGEVGTHPDLDTYVADVQYAVTIEAAQEASLLATKYFVEEACNIPLWGYSSYVGWRREIAGIINEDGYGFENDYTFINAYRTDNPDAPLRMACISSWDRLNMLYSQWYYERALLDRVSTGFIAANPYALTTDQPWACKDWEKSSWTDPRDGMEKTMLTYWLREDIGCVAPITGELVDYFDAYDYEFTVWYNYAYDDSWLWSGFMDVHHVKIVDDYTVEVYFDDASVWFTYSPTGPLLGPEEVLLDLLCEETSATFTGADLVEDPTDYFEYQFTTDHVVQVTSATVNGEPITVDTDFYIRAGYDTFSHNVFVALTTFNPADEIIINYYTSIAGGAGGSYLGGGLGLDWTDTMYSYGYHYPISISGSSAALNVNPYFHLETPILGEVDWRWVWVGTEKPRSGYYKIEIFDVVKAAAAYCTRGDGIYDPAFFAGSDLDASDLSHIGIYDIVSITGRYGNTFGSAP